MGTDDDLSVPPLSFPTGFDEREQRDARMAFRVRILNGDAPAVAAEQVARLFEARFRLDGKGFLIWR